MAMCEGRLLNHYVKASWDITATKTKSSNLFCTVLSGSAISFQIFDVWNGNTAIQISSTLQYVIPVKRNSCLWRNIHLRWKVFSFVNFARTVKAIFREKLDIGERDFHLSGIWLNRMACKFGGKNLLLALSLNWRLKHFIWLVKRRWTT